MACPEAAEAGRIATESLRAECAEVETQNEALEALARRQEALAGRLKRVLAEAEAERSAMREELALILSGAGTGGCPR